MSTIVETKFSFPKNPTLSCTNSYGFLAPYQNLQKTKDTTPTKQLKTERQADPIL